MKRITLGILAHVDSGKTTLSESVLYLSGIIRTLGRVDHRDSYLDNNEMERSRGITIFSKQAEFDYDDTHFTLLDTPGHVDFSAEMERTLSVLDYAILVVSGSEGVQSHTITLWKLLENHNIPTFIFINKSDMPGVNKVGAFSNLKSNLKGHFVDFSVDNPEPEEIALSDESVMETYLEGRQIYDEDISNLIFERRLFPVYYGSALKNLGTDKLLMDLARYTVKPLYRDSFAAKVFKISREEGVRVTHLKITGGELSVRNEISYYDGENEYSEKVSQIRKYSGGKYTLITNASSGDVVSVCGLTHTYSGQALGSETSSVSNEIKPVLSYAISFDREINKTEMYQNLLELSEEDPTLSIRFDEETREIYADVFGPIQIQVLQSIIKERFGIDASFGDGKILYKETVTEPVVGVGHFEPLRHYAEVHLLLEPNEEGEGNTFESRVNESFLARNWQRLILTHVAEKVHRGVLTGSPVTDINFVLVAGKAHLKHTEGGDFRQATYRAIRQGLKKGKTKLLEPYYNFTIIVPTENIGRVINDVSSMSGTVASSETYGESSELQEIKGYAPASTIGSYINEINSFSHGKGTISLSYRGYSDCHNEEEVISERGYDSESDLRNPTGSVFCAHGSGFNVPWDEVDDYAHIVLSNDLSVGYDRSMAVNSVTPSKREDIPDEELMKIFEQTYGPIRRKEANTSKVSDYTNDSKKPYKAKGKLLPNCLLVDGYNIIFAWDELKELAKTNIDAARDRLSDMLSDYQGYTNDTVILVFDAYNVDRKKEDIYMHDNIYIVFTRKAETADLYIAKTTHKLKNTYNVSVATSDALEQLIILGHGATRISASMLFEEIKRVKSEHRDTITGVKSSLENYVIKKD